MSEVDELLEKAERFAGELRWLEAAQVARKALAIAPENRWAKDKLGWYLSRGKQFDEAVAVYGELINQAPDNPKYPYMVGYQFYDQQRYAEAVSWFQRALDLKPDYSIVLYRKGYAHTQLGQTNTAENCFKKCIRVWLDLEDGDAKEREARTYSDACFQLGKIRSDRGEWGGAVNAFAEAVQHDDQDADKHYNLGKALVKSERFAEALDILIRADHLAPRKHYIQTYLARAYRGVGRTEEALELLDRIPSRVKDQFPYIWEHQAEAYLKKNRVKDAIRILGTATRRPSEKSLHSWHKIFLLLGHAHESIDEFQEAYRAYYQANQWHLKSQQKESPLAIEKLRAIETEAEGRGITLTREPVVAIRNAASTSSNSDSPSIKVFFEDKGFGFIERKGEKDLFFHIRNVLNPDDLRIGVCVEFELTDGRKGPEAVQVHILT